MESLFAIGDEPGSLRVLRSEVVFDGKVWDVRRDDVELADGQVVTREVLVHTGAVGVIALDASDQVLLVRQYRHPVRHYLWEPPAGLLDVAGEDPLDAVKRELAEEADLVADDWHVLVDFFNSPGGSTEAFRCYLARGLHEVPEDERHERDGEERDMQTVWVPLDEARELVLTGRLHNPTAVTGILAACAARATDWDALRPADSPWPERSPGR
ncbi:MAG: 8-oxo-dGDP phosphatase [Actinomycetota bacterium]|jgi:ADP-ribose pyrophosphatase|nr:8-oxo-dGDP phosphatase [Actinomycetota bacterium]MDQ1666765.1 8-oxo-dGDP phosphatase [Actinomycetota bacterium]MDQ1668044.1 8-oxo-dGDP phosphatase [Actinomycetota bacterium]